MHAAVSAHSSIFNTLPHFGYLMISFNTFQCIALCTVSLWTSSVWSHVTLEQQQAEVGANYKAVLRVGHGCDGLPTTSLRVQLPTGFQGAKPMPKAGWTLATKAEKLATPYDNHGKQITEDVTEITWAVKSPDFALKDSEYDEFILRGRAAMPTGAAWFKVTQLCQEGSKTGRSILRLCCRLSRPRKLRLQLLPRLDLQNPSPQTRMRATNIEIFLFSSRKHAS